MHHPKQRSSSTDPRIKSVEEVVLVRRAVQAVANAREAELPRWKSASDRIPNVFPERIYGSPHDQRPRTSIAPMQGGVLHSRSQQRVHEHLEAASRMVQEPLPGARSSTPNSQGSGRRAKAPEGERPMTSQGLGRRATPVGEAGSDVKLTALNAKLDALAQRLQAVDARSQVLGHVMGNEGGAASAADEIAMIGDEVNMLRGETPILAGHVSAAPTRPTTGPLTGAASAGKPDAPPKQNVPRALHNIMDNINSVMVGLEHIFITATPGQHQAATKITKLARGFVKRRRYQKGLAALRAYEERQSHGMARFFANWLEDRRLIHSEVKAMTITRDQKLCQSILGAFADHVWSVLPTRINQRQRAYYMMVKTQRRVCTLAFAGWVEHVISRRGAAEVALRNQNRHRRIRDKVELEAEKEGWREELVESVVLRELQEDAIRYVVEKSRSLGQAQTMRLWKVAYRQEKVKRLGLERALGFAGRKSADRMYNAWKQFVEESKRWDADRYTRLRNERELQVQVLRAIYSSFFLAWQQRWRLSMAVKAKLKAVNLRLCLEIAAVWRAQVEVQRTLKLATLERWLVVSKSKTQMPFRRWYLWCADMNNRREAQTLIASMLAKRWAKIRIARMLQGWWGETENGAETGRGREELLNLLNEQQQMNKALEETVSRYKELHNKTEVGLRKYEDILAKREKQIVRIENENNDLTMRLQASAQEVQRLKDLSDLSLREAMLRKAQLAEPNLPPSAAGDGLRISDHAPRAASRGGGERVPSPPGSTTLSSRQGSGGSLASGGSLGLVGSPVVGGAEEEGGGKVGEDGSEAVRDTASPPGGAPLTAPTPTPDPPGGKDIPPGEPPKSATPAPAPAKAPTPPPGGKAPEAAPPPDSKPAAGAGEMVKTAKAAGSIFAAAAPASAVVKQTGGAGAGAGGGKVAGLPGIARPAGAPQLSAPAPLPRIQGFSPAPTPDSIASARTPLPSQPTPPMRRRAASAHFTPEDLDVPLADELLLGRAKHLMGKLRDLMGELGSGVILAPNTKLLPQLLEVLERGTEGGRPVELAGATLSIDAPELLPPPRTLQVGPTAMDSLNWNQLVVGLERFDVRKKRANMESGTGGKEVLVDRLMSARAARTHGNSYAELPAKAKSPSKTARGGRQSAF